MPAQRHPPRCVNIRRKNEGRMQTKGQLVLNIKKMNMHVRVPPEDYDPSAVKHLIPADGPPAGFGTANEPDRPPPAVGLGKGLMVNGAGVP